MQAYTEKISVKGKTIEVNSIRIDNTLLIVTGKLIRMAKIKDEWYENAESPALIIEQLKKSNLRADFFTFIQKPPENKPKYDYYMEWDNVAAIHIKSFDDWWHNQIPKKTRTHVRKSQKRGVLLKEVDYNNELVKGISEIYNETLIRQGKPFWHYGKDFETLKKSHGTFLERSDFIGAFYNNELIGFIKLVYSGKTARTMQIISKNKHRDKSPINALIAKAVEICSKKGISYLVYGEFDYGKGGSRSLTIFKTGNGFRKVLIPRYYIPLNIKGKIILKLKLHHGIKRLLPEKLVVCLLNLRKYWYLKKYTPM